MPTVEVLSDTVDRSIRVHSEFLRALAVAGAGVTRYVRREPATEVTKERIPVDVSRSRRPSQFLEALNIEYVDVVVGFPVDG